MLSWTRCVSRSRVELRWFEYTVLSSVRVRGTHLDNYRYHVAADAFLPRYETSAHNTPLLVGHRSLAFRQYRIGIRLASR